MITRAQCKTSQLEMYTHSQQPQARLEASDLQDFANSYHLYPSELCPPTLITMVYIHGFWAW